MKAFSNHQFRSEYIASINRVIDYIEKNLDKNLTLDTLSEVTNFPRFLFHRIFSAIISETINQFIRKIRVEKAAMLLIDNPEKSIAEIAFDCWFSGSVIFSRVFKEYHKISPSQWRANGYNRENNISKTNSKNSQTLGNILKVFILLIYVYR